MGDTINWVVDTEDKMEVVCWSRQPVIGMVCIRFVRNIDVERSIIIALPVVAVGDIIAILLVVIEEVVFAIEGHTPETVRLCFWPVVRSYM